MASYCSKHWDQKGEEEKFDFSLTVPKDLYPVTPLIARDFLEEFKKGSATEGEESLP